MSELSLKVHATSTCGNKVLFVTLKLVNNFQLSHEIVKEKLQKNVLMGGKLSVATYSLKKSLDWPLKILFVIIYSKLQSKSCD